MRVLHRSSVNDGDRVFDGLDNLLHGERFFDEAVESPPAAAANAAFAGVGDEGFGFVVGELAGHGEDLGHLEFGVHADGFADFLAVDVAEVDVEEDDVGFDFFCGDAGLEAVACDVDIVGGLFGEQIAEHFDDIGFVIRRSERGFW